MRSSTCTAGWSTERDEGRAILLVSLELDEIFSLSDRILVIYEGQFVGEHTGDVSEDQIGFEMVGGRDEGPHERDRRHRPAARAGGRAGTLAARIALNQRAGGIAVPVATVVLAFLIGGLVVAATQHR